MQVLADLSHLEIDWDLDPDDAVVMYMEQPEGGWSLFPSVLPPDALSRYFVVDTWDIIPVVRLLERTVEWLRQLAVFPVPDAFRPVVREHFGLSKGIYAPPEELRVWLKSCMGQE